MNNFFFNNKISKSDPSQEFKEISSNYSREFSKGKSFKFSIWNETDTYNNDMFVQDFVTHNQSLWACRATELTNIPPDLERDVPSNNNRLWDRILDGVSDIVFDQDGNKIVWRYEDESTWRDLIELDVVSESEIKNMLAELEVQLGNTYDSELSETSTNAVQNQAVTKKFKELDDKNTKTDGELVNIKSSVATTLSNAKSYTDSKISVTKRDVDTELEKKVDKVSGKGLSANDFNNEYKAKLDNLNSSLNNTLSSAKSYTNSEITKVDNKINSEISRAKTSETNLSDRIDDLEEGLTNALNEAKEYTDSEVKNNTNKINILNGAGEGSVKKTVKDEIAKVIDSAPAAFDTLKEIADYINEDQEAAAVIANDLVEHSNAIEENKSEIIAISKNVTELSAEKEDNANKVITITDESTDEQYPSAKAVYALKERIEENEILIGDLQNTKIDKEADDYYPQLSVGVADNLAGVDEVASDFNFRRSGGGAISDGVARIEAIKGNSVVWNQLCIRGSVKNGNASGISYSINANGVFSLNGQTSDNYAFILPDYVVNYIAGHKYILLGKETDVVKLQIFLQQDNVSTSILGSGIFTCNNTITASGMPRYRVNPNSLVENFKGIISLIDLTQMFGAGNEPTTIEEFYARIPMGVDLNAYNEGEVIHMDVQSIESVGVNQWDEEWELGKLATSTGALQESAKYIRTKNFIPVLPNTDYYKHSPKTSFYWHCYYDKEKNFISSSGHGMNAVFRTPSNAFYMKTFSEESYGVTYNHDICINISDTSINGKYFPYVKRTEDLSIIRKYFPQGMKSAGSAHDEIRYNKATQKWEYSKGRFRSVDLGTCDWTQDESDATRFRTLATTWKATYTNNLLCEKYATAPTQDISLPDKSIAMTNSQTAPFFRVKDSDYTDAASLKASLQGVILYYESNDWEWAELDAEDQFKDLDYQVWNCGTEKAIADGKSAPLAADITYGFNAIGKIKELEKQMATLMTQLAQMQTQISSMGGVISDITIQE